MHPSSDANTWSKMSWWEERRVAPIVSVCVDLGVSSQLLFHCPSAIFELVTAQSPDFTSWLPEVQYSLLPTSTHCPSGYDLDPQ